MTDVLVETSKAVVEAVTPVSATVSVVSATDTVLINPPDLHYIQAFDNTSQTAA